MAAGLKTSRRTLFILQEIRKKGEGLNLPEWMDLPDENSSQWWSCKIEFPLTKELVAKKGNAGKDDAARYKLFVVHIHPKESLYAGGWFRLEIDLRETKDYPMNPPKARFLTKIWHPNINEDGSICHSHLKLPGPPHEGTWKPMVRLEGLISGIASMFNLNDEGFNPDDPLNIPAAQQFVENRSAFEGKAKNWVKQYAAAIDVDPVNLGNKSEIDDE